MVILLDYQLKLFMDLGGNAYKKKSIQKIYKLKNRPKSNPLNNTLL